MENDLDLGRRPDRGAVRAAEHLPGRAEVAAAGLVSEAGGGAYRYDPQTPELEQVVDQLAQEYAARPLAIVRAILAAPNEKIQTLADAFKVKRD